MLHAVPELLDALERRLVAGEDPSQLLAGIRWSELVGWPVDAASAGALKQRIHSVQALVMGLSTPLRAAMAGLSDPHAYGRQGIPSEVPIRTARLQEKV